MKTTLNYKELLIDLEYELISFVCIPVFKIMGIFMKNGKALSKDEFSTLKTKLEADESFKECAFIQITNELCAGL